MAIAAPLHRRHFSREAAFAAPLWPASAFSVHRLHLGANGLVDFNAPGQYGNNFNSWNDAGGSRRGQLRVSGEHNQWRRRERRREGVSKFGTTATFRSGSWISPPMAER